jgi:hypothetical protein
MIRNASLGYLIMVLAACGPSEIPPVATETLASASPEATQVATLDAAAFIWLEQPFGEGETLAVLFYEEMAQSERAECVRFLVSYPLGVPPVSACQRARMDSMVVAIGTAQMKRAGQPDAPQTIIVGRVLAPDVVTVALEFTEREPIIVDVESSGFIAIFPGWENKPIQAVPINQFGNLVGEIYKFP